ncbi:unnamed protein product [Nippostrongylus brasiliensis]|uniref:FBN-1A.1 (inferred by orthology to a C. elegans protein) n=1 Tax=Nippostrongylus brasiliensis TaxID=27835 RepID=A0A0N4YFS1_NIPBR|nr:unnamed protein product [Nippostrongylus brasiliensis]
MRSHDSSFLGDGISCFPVRSCRSDPNVCHNEAICLPSGQCLCKHGFRGNGYDCTRISPRLRTQQAEAQNACANSCDHDTELCIDSECVCKSGFERHSDGRCVVFCEPDGMTLVLGNETTAFEGRIFVRGQAENPHCAKTFSPLQHASKPYMFKVPFEHCNIRLEDHDTFATTVIVQKHPMFITTAADAYDLRCTYPVGVREVESNVNVSDLTTSSTLTDNAHGPSCRLTVTNEADESIAAAVVGQALRLRLEVLPNETYSILPRNCFAINIETGERYSLTDKAGCAIDDQLFPEWTKIRPSMTEAVFRTFKWPDSSMIRFQCDCSACVGLCPEMNCGRRREAAMKRFRFRRVRHVKNGTAIDERITDADYDDDEEEKQLLQKVINSKRLAFSTLVKTMFFGVGLRGAVARGATNTRKVERSILALSNEAFHPSEVWHSSRIGRDQRSDQRRDIGVFANCRRRGRDGGDVPQFGGARLRLHSTTTTQIDVDASAVRIDDRTLITLITLISLIF